MTTIYVTRPEQKALRELIDFCTAMAKELGTTYYEEQLEQANSLHQKIKRSRYGGDNGDKTSS